MKQTKITTRILAVSSAMFLVLPAAHAALAGVTGGDSAFPGSADSCVRDPVPVIAGAGAILFLAFAIWSLASARKHMRR